MRLIEAKEGVGLAGLAEKRKRQEQEEEKKQHEGARGSFERRNAFLNFYIKDKMTHSLNCWVHQQ